MDRTTLTLDTGLSWMGFLRSRGEVPTAMVARALWWSTLYKLAVLDMETVMKRLVADLEGDAEADLVRKAAIWHAERVECAVAGGAERAIAAHRERGDLVVLLTGSTQYAAELVARGLGIEHVLCSRLEVEDGKFTGRLAAMCFGRHKVARAETFAADRGIDLARSWFYSDSYNDLPMLSRVGLP